MKPRYTLYVADEEDARLRKLLRHFGATVPGFATTIVEDLAWLEVKDLHTVRSQIQTLADDARDRAGKRRRAA